MIPFIRVSLRTRHADAGIHVQVLATADVEALVEGGQIDVAIDRATAFLLQVARDGHHAFHVHRGYLGRVLPFLRHICGHKQSATVMDIARRGIVGIVVPSGGGVGVVVAAHERGAAFQRERCARLGDHQRLADQRRIEHFRT